MRTYTIHRRVVVVLGLALLLALSAVSQVPRARATDPLTVTTRCDTSPGVFVCHSSATGGTGEYTYTWKAVQNAFFAGSVHDSFVRGSCTIGKAFVVKVVVIDSAGAKTHAEDGAFCSDIGP